LLPLSGILNFFAVAVLKKRIQKIEQLVHLSVVESERRFLPHGSVVSRFAIHRVTALNERTEFSGKGGVVDRMLARDRNHCEYFVIKLPNQLDSSASGEANAKRADSTRIQNGRTTHTMA
jgi:hypothetical protein